MTVDYHERAVQMRGRAPRDRCPTVGSGGAATPAGAARKDADQRCSVVPVRRGSVRAFCNDPAEACQFCVPSPQQVAMGRTSFWRADQPVPRITERAVPFHQGTCCRRVTPNPGAWLRCPP